MFNLTIYILKTLGINVTKVEVTNANYDVIYVFKKVALVAVIMIILYMVKSHWGMASEIVRLQTELELCKGEL